MFNKIKMVISAIFKSKTDNEQAPAGNSKKLIWSNIIGWLIVALQAVLDVM